MNLLVIKLNLENLYIVADKNIYSVNMCVFNFEKIFSIIKEIIKNSKFIRNVIKQFGKIMVIVNSDKRLLTFQFMMTRNIMYI